jgi:hypothetical protein
MIALAHSMPDSQSAVLACLVWQASLHERLARGPLAGRFVARLSGAQLADMTGRPLRTIRHALRRLTEEGVIHREQSAPGRKAVYAPSLAAERQTPPEDSVGSSLPGAAAGITAQSEVDDHPNGPSPVSGPVASPPAETGRTE